MKSESFMKIRKFDIVVANPPYQMETRKMNSEGVGDSDNNKEVKSFDEVISSNETEENVILKKVEQKNKKIRKKENVVVVFITLLIVVLLAVGGVLYFKISADKSKTVWEENVNVLVGEFDNVSLNIASARELVKFYDSKDNGSTFNGIDSSSFKSFLDDSQKLLDEGVAVYKPILNVENLNIVGTAKIDENFLENVKSLQNNVNSDVVQDGLESRFDFSYDTFSLKPNFKKFSKDFSLDVLQENIKNFQHLNLSVEDSVKNFVENVLNEEDSLSKTEIINSLNDTKKNIDEANSVIVNIDEKQKTFNSKVDDFIGSEAYHNFSETDENIATLKQTFDVSAYSKMLKEYSDSADDFLDRLISNSDSNYIAITVEVKSLQEKVSNLTADLKKEQEVLNKNIKNGESKISDLEEKYNSEKKQKELEEQKKAEEEAKTQTDKDLEDLKNWEKEQAEREKENQNQNLENNDSDSDVNEN